MDEINKDVVVAGLPLRPAPCFEFAAGLAPGLGFLSAFTAQFNPVQPIEHLLVEELARRAGQMREFDTALSTLRREHESALANIVGSRATESDAAFSVARASVLGSGQHESILRQGLAASRGLYRALRELHEFKEIQAKNGGNNLLLPDHRFRSEQSCCAYLVRRYVQGMCRCRCCGAVRCGCFVASRLAWECGHCKTQTGLRHGTCMERSPLPLTLWFFAIRLVLWHPAITPVDLKTMLRIHRVQTVRTVVTRIQKAMESDDASAMLAGLDEAYSFPT
jgi:hypothetical protein